MAKQEEYAEITVNGRRYRDWQTVAVTREMGNWASFATFTAASPAESGETWAGVRLKIGDECTIKMAGEVVAYGVIQTRQVGYSSRQHGLQVTVISKTDDLVKLTVDLENGGEFKKSSFGQIARSLMKPTGVELTMEGDLEGADKPFPRFNVRPGEMIMSAIERLGRMRNLYFTDDAQGRLVAMRGRQGEKAEAEIVEGRNIKSANIVLSDQYAVDKIKVIGQQPGNDQTYGRASSQTEGEAKRSSEPSLSGGRRKMTVTSEMAGDDQDMKMRAEREMAENIATQLICNVVVQGWRSNGGKLWSNMVGKHVSVVSPFMFPGDGKKTLGIQSVVQRQSEGGTVTELTLVLPEWLHGKGGTTVA